jgi:hypothetical protein
MSRSGTGRVTLTRKHSFWGDYPPRGTLGVVSTPLFLSRDPRTAAVVRRMPPLTGAPVRVDVVRALRDRRGPVHAASFLRQRRIALDCTRAEFPRIFVHEVAHFIWLRLGNPARFGYERVLRAEIAAPARGELGWSAQWRKLALRPEDIDRRTRRWREYCCESFCDSAAWLYGGIERHQEFTLGASWRRGRRAWFAATLGNRTLSI